METELQRIWKKVNDVGGGGRTGSLERKVRELQVEAIVFGVVVSVPLVKNGHVFDDCFCNSLSKLRRMSMTAKRAPMENCWALLNLQLVGGGRRERGVELHDVVALRFEIHFRHIFGEQRHEIVHDHDVTRKSRGDEGVARANTWDEGPSGRKRRRWSRGNRTRG